MAFKNGAYATVWEVKQTKSKSLNVRISTSYKDKNTNQYVDDFSGYVFFAGRAAEKVASCKQKDRIKLVETSVTSRYNRDTKETRYDFTVWDIETDVPSGRNGGKSSQGSLVPPKAAPVADDKEDLPF